MYGKLAIMVTPLNGCKPGKNRKLCIYIHCKYLQTFSRQILGILSKKGINLEDLKKYLGKQIPCRQFLEISRKARENICKVQVVSYIAREVYKIHRYFDLQNLQAYSYLQAKSIVTRGGNYRIQSSGMFSPFFNFQSQFSMSKIIRIFLIFFH